uniref:Uncharacterized protein n=1 Tax=Anopheles atroparvus TaxID=41427 RepID=A0A182JN76_ANOAO
MLGIAPLHIISTARSKANGRWSAFSRIQLISSLLIIALAVCGYVYKFYFRFQVKNLPFFNNLLYNLELLLEITNTPIGIVACQRKRHMYDHVLHRFAALHQEGDQADLRWLRTWFHRLFLVAAGTFLVMLVVDGCAWQNPVMSLASICSVHIPTMITALTVSQYWYAIMFILRQRRHMNRVLGSYSGGRYGTRRLVMLEALRRQHKELHELTLYVIDGYGKLLLNTTMLVAVVLNVELLELYQYFLHGVTSATIFWFIMYALIWLFLHLGLLLMILYPCHWVEYEVGLL